MTTRKSDLNLPEDLATEVDACVARGEFADTAAVAEAALRYYLERHTGDAWADYVAEEIQEGLDESA